MMKKSGKLTLAEKISSVLNATPISLDPEDQQDETTAKLTSVQDDFDHEDDEQLLSKFRQQNVDLLADIDQKYLGKKSSRNHLKGSDSESGTGDEDNDENEKSEYVNSEEIEDIDQPSEDEYENSDHSEQHSDTASNSSFQDGHGDLSQIDNSDFQHLKETSVSAQINKGLAVRNQAHIWENLLEIRIQLQKMLLAANKLPQKGYYSKIQKESGLDFSKKAEETKDNITNVLEKMLRFQSLMVKSYPETKKLENLKQNDNVKNSDFDDEEIPSDTDEEDLLKSDSELDDQIIDKPPSKKRKLEDVELELNTFHNKYKEYRNITIEKWNTKTRLSVTKNSGQTHSVVNQIEHILNDKEKLLKKTQLNRTGFKIVAPVEKMDNAYETSGLTEEYNTEIFDDTDFYHQLLRELIEVKSADVTDPIQLGRQWIQLQNLRSKYKKKVDTKASKGRKIRYAVHTKLINFMAPFDNYSWTDEAKNELFSSLFGKSKPKAVSTN